jgi:pyruvate/2-oxoglutarate dehydrogenase complex dihydrolipoamide acyltransferase (E2) component
LRPGPTARAAAVLVVFLALFIAVDRLSGQRPPRSGTATGSSGTVAPTTSRPAAPATTRAPASTAPPTTAPTTTAPTTTASTTSEPTGATGATGTTLRSPKGVTVQVLNGVFVPGLAHRVADRIRRAGYDVVAANTALGSYSVSRIYYTDGHKADAEAFQARFPAFKVILPASQAQARLSREVALHVIIGQNYRDI